MTFFVAADALLGELEPAAVPVVPVALLDFVYLIKNFSPL